MDKDLFYSVELGGFNFPTPESNFVLSSAQQIKIIKNQSLKIKMVSFEKERSIVIKKIRYRFASQQGRQDVNIGLWVGSEYFRTGKYHTTGYKLTYEKEDRTAGSSSNYAGGYLTSSTAEAGKETFPDNFETFDDFHAYGALADKIFWVVTNQSNFYNHVIQLELSGWQLHGQSVKTVMKSLANLYERK